MTNIKFMTDENGVKTDVILNINEYYSLLDELEDMKDISERLDEEVIPHNIVKNIFLENE